MHNTSQHSHTHTHTHKLTFNRVFFGSCSRSGKVPLSVNDNTGWTPFLSPNEHGQICILFIGISPLQIQLNTASLQGPQYYWKSHAIWDHRVTYQPVQATFLPLPPAKLVFYLATPDGCKADLANLADYILRRYTYHLPKDHTSTNQAQHRLTSLI